MKILIVCAPQTFGYNLGMLSVDLAAYHFLEENFPDAELEFITIYPHKFQFNNIPYSYTSLQDYPDVESVFLEKDIIFMWGDFLNAHQYRADITKILIQKKLYKNEKEAKEAVRKFLYLYDMPDKIVNKTILYGGTILFNSAEDYQEDSYRKDMIRLFERAKSVYFREAYSAQMVCYFRGNYTESSLGTDAALLLSPDKLKQYCRSSVFSSKARHKKRVGIFIGRDNFDTKLASNFIDSVANGLDADIKWLNWGGAPFFLDKTSEFKEALPRLEFSDDQLSLPETLVSLAIEYDYIITDTYHVCVNAWNFGTPAVCLIDNLDATLTVNSGGVNSRRDKRQVLLWTYNADAFVVLSSDVISEDLLKAKAEKIVLLLRNNNACNWVMQLIKSHSDYCKKVIKKAVVQLNTRV